jgi:hypothetical protein
MLYGDLCTRALREPISLKPIPVHISYEKPGPLESSTVLIYETQALLLKLKLYNEAYLALTILIQFPAQSGPEKTLLYNNYL